MPKNINFANGLRDYLKYGKRGKQETGEDGNQLRRPETEQLETEEHNRGDISRRDDELENEGQGGVGRVKTPLKPQYRGKLIYAQVGTGKSTIADNVTVFDSDYLLGQLIGTSPETAGFFFNSMSPKQKEAFGEQYRDLINQKIADGYTVLTADRDTKYIFIKCFVKENGGRIINFESITVKQGEEEVSMSNHEIEPSKVKKKLRENKLLWNRFSDGSNSLGENQGLAITQPEQDPNPNKTDSGLNPHSESKDTQNNDNSQGKSNKNNDGGQKISFSISPDEDSAYMSAVESGDMETAGRMVREAARRVMPDTKVVDENGEPLVVYHGTNLTRVNNSTPFWVFYEDQHFGSAEQAKDAIPRSRRFKELARIYRVFLDIKNPKRVDDVPMDWIKTHSEYWEPIVRQVKEEGHDGIDVTDRHQLIDFYSTARTASRLAAPPAALQTSPAPTTSPGACCAGKITKENTFRIGNNFLSLQTERDKEAVLTSQIKKTFR